MEEALILEPGCTAPVAEIGRLIASHLDLPLSDATARVRYGSGIVVERADPAKVRQVKEKLDREGVPTRAVPANALSEVPCGFRTIALDLRDDAILARRVGGSVLTLLREEIRGLLLYGLMPSDGRESDDASGTGDGGRNRQILASTLMRSLTDAGSTSGLSPRGRKLLANLSEAGLTKMQFHMTLYCLEPTGPVRFHKDELDFSCLGRQKQSHSLDNFLLLVDGLLEYLPGAWNRQAAVDFMKDLDPRMVLRAKQEEVTNFDRWMCQWLRIDEVGEDRPPGEPAGEDPTSERAAGEAGT